MCVCVCVCVCVFPSPILFKSLGVIAPPPRVLQHSFLGSGSSSLVSLIAEAPSNPRISEEVDSAEEEKEEEQNSLPSPTIDDAAPRKFQFSLST
jgi:hypothetical protein